MFPPSAQYAPAVGRFPARYSVQGLTTVPHKGCELIALTMAISRASRVGPCSVNARLQLFDFDELSTQSIIGHVVAEWAALARETLLDR
jgi:hypothetical protein